MRAIETRLARQRWYPQVGLPELVLRLPDAVTRDRPQCDGFVWLPRPGPTQSDVRYYVYANDGRGGPIDRGSPVAGPLDSPGWVPARLAFPGEYSFLVRSFDPCGRVEYGLDSVVGLALDDQGEACSVS